MDSLVLAEKRIPKKDLMTGIGTSLLVHVLAFSAAFIWALLLPHKPLKPPWCTVNLVTLKDIGAGSPELKGSPKAAEETPESVANARQKPEPAAPIKRLAIDESAIRPETHIKKMEPKEVPVAPEKPQSLEAIEKNLDKLIAKPKVIPHTSTAQAQHQAETQPKTPAQAVNQTGDEKPVRGTPSADTDASAKGAAHGSQFGSPGGSTGVSAVEEVYVQRVINAIKQEFKLPAQDFTNLEAKIFFVVNRDGKVLSFQVEKPAGNNLFDGAAVRAIQNANIPPMPPAMRDPKTEIRLRFTPSGVS
jgi:protein TonB